MYSKGNSQQKKRPSSEWKKISSNHIFYKGLIPKIITIKYIKNSHNSIAKRRKKKPD